MNALAIAIQSEGLSGSAASVLASLLADAVIGTDSTAYSMSGAADRLEALGLDVGVLVNFRALTRNLPIGGDTMEGMLLTAGEPVGGMDFSRGSIRYQLSLNQVHPSTTADQQLLVAAYLQIGITNGPLWRKYVTAEPDISAVQTALAEIAAQQAAEAATTAKAELRVWLRQRCDEIDLAIVADQIGTQEAAVAAWGE